MPVFDGLRLTRPTRLTALCPRRPAARGLCDRYSGPKPGPANREPTATGRQGLRDRPRDHAGAVKWGTVFSRLTDGLDVRIGVYFAIRKFASVCAIEVNTPLSWLACCTS